MWVGTLRRRKQHSHVWAGCENPSVGAFFLLPVRACIAGVKQCLRICNREPMNCYVSGHNSERSEVLIRFNLVGAVVVVTVWWSMDTFGHSGCSGSILQQFGFNLLVRAIRVGKILKLCFGSVLQLSRCSALAITH